MHVDGQTIRSTREALGEHQAQFGIRFEVTRRTIIRWEKAGNEFSEWGGWRREDRKTAADLWRDVVKATKVTPKTAKRRRGSATRRRSVVRGKASRAKK